MSDWLTEVKKSLNQRATPVTFFFRDDDAGWSNDRLFALLDVFARYELPIDLAAIPQATTIALAEHLLKRLASTPELVAVHQHGFAHLNHELQGKKTEFGATRSAQLQMKDISSGREKLFELFGAHLQPIFTPPWNRCSRVTGHCLSELGFRILSRDHTAEACNIVGLSELPVCIDWFKQQRGIRLTNEQIGSQIATAVQQKPVVGIMLHHALIDEKERHSLQDLLRLLTHHPAVQCLPMMRVISPQSSVSN
ncbi:MAG: hypothetical protein AB1757_18900 [Acidobacteriota bacterium]